MKFRHGVILALTLALSALTAPAHAQSDVYQLDIQAQPLSGALKTLADQTGVQVVFFTEVTQGEQSPAVIGDYSIEQALEAILAGTGLVYEYLGEDGQSVTVRRPAPDTVGQRQPGIEEIIVTGQKREERIQDVPIAISAFSPEDLEAQKIEGGFDLLKGVPNVTFSKTNFSSYNFQIRGIGTQAVSATTDPAVAVSFNNTTLIVNRLFEQEYLDVERVEVLRGPQGTLFGRNATAGVINVLSNKPEMGVWDGMIDVEVGNYNTRRLRGFFNAPIGDEWAIRGAYASTKRDGYGINEAASDEVIPAEDRPQRDVDNRDLWTGRFTIGWQPNDRLRFNLLWERFEEDDRRVRTSKQLCHNDSPEMIGDQVIQEQPNSNPMVWAKYSQGCKGGSLYADGAFGTPNGASLPFLQGIFTANTFAALIGKGDETWVLGPNPYWPGFENPIMQGEGPDNAPCEFMTLIGVVFAIDICNPDPYRGLTQSRDLRQIYSLLEPEYRAEADIFELSFDWEWTDNLLFSSQTVYVQDEYFATQDFNRFTSFPVWNDPSEACGLQDFFGFTIPDCSEEARGTLFDGYFNTLFKDGRLLCDPQLGCSDSLVAQDLSRAESTQFNQEFRLVSSYGGDWDFSLGANFTNFETLNDYFVFANAFTYFLQFPPFDNGPGGNCPGGTGGENCRYVDPNPIDSIDGEGHNYFRSANPYELTSSAVFGELYWRATENVKVTAGLRLTWDRKVFTPIPSQLLLQDYRELGNVNKGDPPPTPESCLGSTACPLSGNAINGRGSPASPDIVQEWREPTGRLVVDWQPLLDWTDETLLYASFARGYKGGGANPPGVAPPSGLVLAKGSGAAAPKDFGPEFVNAYELGTKNTLFGGLLTLNGTAFYYDYKDYQVSKIVDRQAVNENFDSEVWGLEFESVFAPSLNWQFNAAIGYLQTEVADGEKSIDLMDRIDGGKRHFAPAEGADTDFPHGFDDWTVIKPWVVAASNCVAPTELLEANVEQVGVAGTQINVNGFCPTGGLTGIGGGTTNLNVAHYQRDANGDHVLDSDGNRILVVGSDSDFNYDPSIDAPNNGAGFFKDLSGNEMPNAPHFTVTLGGQYNFDLTPDWRATARVDYYWQDESYARIYNTEIDRLKSWSNTNLSFWVTNPNLGITVEGYVKNLFDETPITGTFLNSDDAGLTTNVFTLDPRLIGVSVRKEF